MMSVEYYLRHIHEQYPHLEICKGQTGYILQGNFVLNHDFNGIRMTGNFKLMIFIPNNYPVELPIVKELSNCINQNYPHRYTNGQLCLASNIDRKSVV